MRDHATIPTAAPVALQPPPPESDLAWYHFVERGGAAGRRWVACYTRGEPREIRAAVDRALTLCRRRRLAEARELLDEAHERLVSLPVGGDPALRHVLSRWHLGTLAYYHYMTGELDLAERASVQAHVEIEQALEPAPFLLPLAHHAHEFRLQRARIARSRRRWAELREHVRAVEEMMTDRWPLVRLNWGDVHVSDVFRFLDEIPDLTPDERVYIDRFRDPAVRLDEVTRFVGGIYALPGFVIRFP